LGYQVRKQIIFLISELKFTHFLSFISHSVCNVVCVDDNIEAIQIPDVTAVDLLNQNHQRAQPDESDEQNSKFSMAAGNFCEIYGTPANAGNWDAVLTCFFMDTAAVPME
jgi:carnosine N-methyltransferase